jgi:flagellar basal-body rod modification protein FlgD
MQIDSSVTPSTPVGTTSAANSSSADSSDTNAAIDSTDALGDENTFLTLLVAQIQNQDPTQPIDSTTFLTQLASFSQLEQLIGIRQDVSELDPTAGATSTTGTTTSGTQGS